MLEEQEVVNETLPYSGAKNNTLKRFLGIPEIGVLIPFLIIIIVIGLIAPVFFSVNNLAAVVRSISFIGIVSVGMTLVMLTGEIDVSVGSVAGLGAICATWFMVHGMNPFIGIIVGVVLCGLVGFVNGIFVVKFKVPSFITTIGMLYAARGIAMVISKGYPMYPLPKSFVQIGAMTPLGTSWAFISFIGLVIIFDQILRRTVYGRSLYTIGDNKEVAKLAGINVDKLKISTFIISSIFAGLAGILLASQLSSGEPTIGTGWELMVIAGVAVGGISLLGGSGTIIGTLIGVFILGVLNNGLVLLKISTNWQTVAIGAVMVGAVLIDIIRRNKKVG